jgi:4-hydroxybutyryl-CoA dehydratase/vinylacetyl-CoA-Delta-isomerase
MTPDQYKQSLSDGREIYWDGERIEDVTSHPAFALPLEVAAADYDYHDPAKRELFVYQTELGEPAHRVYQLPRSEEDLLKRLEMAAHLSLVGGVTGVYMALLNVVDDVKQVSPRYAENIVSVYEHARSRDLRAAEVITDAKGDRSRRAHEQDDPDLYVRIVDRKSDGIVVRGAKLHITGASLVHEQVVMPTKAMRPEEADYAVSFSIPTNTSGVKIINRSFAEETPVDPFDYPFSARASMPEGFVVFDDVFVPWERVFLAGETHLAGHFARALGLWERTLGLAEAVEHAEIIVGLAALVTEQQGKERKPDVQNTLAELIAYAELLRMSLDYAVRNFERTPSGMVTPNVLAVNVAKYHYAAHFHDMVRNLQDVSGGLVLTLPKKADLDHPVAGPLLRKYLHTRDGVAIEDRMRVFNGIRDLTADSYGGWQQVVALQAGGGLLAQRVMMNRTFDVEAAKIKALRAVGVSIEE